MFKLQKIKDKEEISKKPEGKTPYPERRNNKNYIPLLEAYNLEGSEMKYLKC